MWFLKTFAIYNWFALQIDLFEQRPTSLFASAFVPPIRYNQKKHHYELAIQPLLKSNAVGDGNEPSSEGEDPTVATGDDLTKQALNMRFWETRDYYRQNPQENMSQVDVCRKLLSTRLPNVRLNRCFVAPSTIKGAGNGLFAKRDIASDELITMYPGDAVLIVEKPESPTSPNKMNTKLPTSPATDDALEESSPSLPPVVGVMFGSHVQEENRDPNLVASPEAKRYEMAINRQTSIVADPTLGFDDAAYLGHFANDGAALVAFDVVSREAYAKQSLERHNSAHFVMEGAHMVTVATKSIAKGEEIFVSYEEGYWLSRSLAGMSDMDTTKKIALLVEAKTKTSLSVSNKSSGINASKDQRAEKKGGSSQRNKNKGFGK